ncbi:poly-beta-1,6-N-acetyl-D-glucosamine biosynthesis protein PgaD [Neobacillus sp. Marseille-QA0830]
MNIIDGRQKKRWKVAEMMATIFGWLVMIGLSIQIFTSLLLWAFNSTYIYNELFIFGSIKDTVFIFSMTLFISVVSFIVLFAWGKYNYHRYGKLDRRGFPDHVSQEELAQYFQLPPVEVEKYHSDKYILIEKNFL